jgi:acyl-coenzyme A synthetase/AMP-(fatty) acid ligase
MIEFYSGFKELNPSISLVIERMGANGSLPALFWKGNNFSYKYLLTKINYWDKALANTGIGRGSVCAFQGDYSPMVCALIFSLMKNGAILVPFTQEIATEIESFIKISSAEFIIRFSDDDTYEIEKLNLSFENSLITSFKERNHPGLIVFTSGSTGQPKGILHDCENVMEKFIKPRPGWRTVLFLLMDHFGGFNTLLSTFAYLGTGICVEKRTPHDVAKVIEQGKANLLPTTPTFLNLIISNKIDIFFDLKSIELITYGTELMSQTTLEKTIKIFPKAKIKQTYGLSEQGVLHSKSENNNSTWLKIGGPGFETKVLDNVLWIRSKSNMVGYLNALNPFDAQGWLCTGDEVEVKGEFIKFKGRKSEVINVGGKKVYPIEVENILLKIANIKDASVFAKSHEIMGQIVHANIITFNEEDPRALIQKIRKFCYEQLPRYKVPVKFNISNKDELFNARFKKIRLDK